MIAGINKKKGTVCVKAQVRSYCVLDEAVPATHTLHRSCGSNTSSSLRCSAGTPAADVDVKMALISLSPEVATMIGNNDPRNAA